MATSILAEQNRATAAEFKESSRALAVALATLRDLHAPTDRPLADRFEELRWIFAAFAVVAVRDDLTLRALSRIYQDVARMVRHMTHTEGPVDVDGQLATVRGLTYLCADLVTSGTRPVFRQPH